MIFKANKDIKDIIRKSTLFSKVPEENISLFRTKVKDFFKFLEDGQTEDTQRGFLHTFLDETYYKDKYLIMDEQNRKDLSILGGYKPSEKCNVFIEAKSTVSQEMVSEDDLQNRAFYETILYYMEERAARNDELKYVVITNMREWCVIDALEYDRIFWRNNAFRKKFEQFKKGQLSYSTTEDFYNLLAAPFVRESNSTLRYIYFNLEAQTIKQDGAVRQNVENIYKLLSPKFLLKQYERNDNNHLNKNFYLELLHIMGLEEIEEDNKTLIKRKNESDRSEGSIIENAIEQIKTVSVSKLNVEGDTDEEKIFNAALQLAIIWVNRLLFLKLLEAQLLRYNEGSERYRFLDREKIKNFNDVDTLFFRVLAIPEDERSRTIKDCYPLVPYLNSSLFEVSDLENQGTRIARLDNNAQLKLFSNSVLKLYVKNSKKEPSPLEYLLLFLDSYNFGDRDDDGQKQLISASVLGLIFEKINGYKDGAIFTPSKITMCLSRYALRKAVVDKFNKEKGWTCKDLNDVYNSIVDKKEANRIINSIRICDPAVGSGHFLVSALNEMISIKSYLDIILDKDGKKLRDYRIEVRNDELIVTNNDGEYVEYHPSKNYSDSQRVQEVLFTEKKTIIENCLFGVDINSNSVNICRLRLWIELLKSTYYDRVTDKLITLPNIDINIKHGNSLVSKFPVKIGAPIGVNTELAKKLKASITRYKDLVSNYKHDSNKKNRIEIDEEIQTIKKRFINNGVQSLGFYDDVINYKDPYHDSLEWMIEFPEVLDGEAKFVGFDVIIGNPPYINLQKLGKMSKFYMNLPHKNKTRKTYTAYDSQADLYTLFYELGYLLVRDGGLVCFITSNSWMRTEYGKKIRKFFVEKTNPILLVDFNGFQIFENVTVETNILLFSKDNNRHQTMAANVGKEDYKLLDNYLEDNLIVCDYSKSDFWYILQPQDQIIMNKVKKYGTQLKSKRWNLFVRRGIPTGNNEAFIIDSQRYQNIVEGCSSPREKDLTVKLLKKVIKGEDVRRFGYEWNNKYLITTFPSINHEISLYPSLIKHLESFEKEKLLQHGYEWIANNHELLKIYCHQKLLQAGNIVKINGQTIALGKDPKKVEKSRKKTPHKWFELQDSIAYWRDFEKPKLIWKRIGSDVRFAYDETGIYSIDSTCIATGNRIKYLCGVFNSSMGKYLLKYTPKTGTGDSLVSVQAFNPIYVPIPSKEDEIIVSHYVDILSAEFDEETMLKLNNKIYSLYGIEDYDLIRYVESVI